MIGVTGANGLLGSFIIRKLIEEKAAFTAFKRKSSDTSLLEDVQEKIEWRDLDLQDPVSVEDAVRGLSSVIHAGALVSFARHLAPVITQVNTEGTRNLVNACLANNVRRLVYISSVGALGRLKGQTTIDESNKWVDNGLQTPYATSKYYGELEVFRGQEEGLSTVIVNPSVILAPADWTKSSAQLFKYVWNERPFYLDGSLNYVDVRDVAAVTWMLLKSGMENERFIVNAGAVSFKDFFDAVASRFGTKPPMRKLSNNILKIVAGVEAVRSRIRKTEPLISPETARMAGTFFLYQNQKIKNTLQFEFRALDATLDWCCRYYMQKFALKKQ
jgi:dihydroflavonol-4-reductase